MAPARKPKPAKAPATPAQAGGTPAALSATNPAAAKSAAEIVISRFNSAEG